MGLSGCQNYRQVSIKTSGITELGVKQSIGKILKLISERCLNFAKAYQRNIMVVSVR